MPGHAMLQPAFKRAIRVFRVGSIHSALDRHAGYTHSLEGPMRHCTATGKPNVAASGVQCYGQPGAFWRPVLTPELILDDGLAPSIRKKQPPLSSTPTCCTSMKSTASYSCKAVSASVPARFSAQYPAALNDFHTPYVQLPQTDLQHSNNVIDGMMQAPRVLSAATVSASKAPHTPRRRQAGKDRNKEGRAATVPVISPITEQGGLCSYSTALEQQQQQRKPVASIVDNRSSPGNGESIVTSTTDGAAAGTAAGKAAAVSGTPSWLPAFGKVPAPAGAISDGYFVFYSDIRVHDTMLRDAARTGAYAKALLRSPDLLRDKVVLDVGCGTGILSMLAAKAGAAHVYGVEASGMAATALRIIRDNDLHRQVTIIQGRIEDVELPVEHVDIVVSEWMGYCLLFESMLPSVLHARDKWLRPTTGVMLPSSATVHLTGAGIEGLDGSGLGGGSPGADLVDRKRSKLDFWNNVCGFRMSALKEQALSVAYTESIDQRALVTDTDTLVNWDLRTVPAAAAGGFSSDFTLVASRDCEVTALVATFDVEFAGGCRVVLSTAANSPPTHWQQTVLYLKEDVALRRGEKLTGRIDVRPSPLDARALQLQVEWLHRGAVSKSKGTQLYTLC